MKEKSLREKGVATVALVIIIVLLIGAIGGGVGYIVYNKKEEDSTSSSKKNKERQFTANIDMTEYSSSLEGTEWTFDIYGTDESLDKMVLTVAMKDYLETAYKSAKSTYDSYDDFLDEAHTYLEEYLDGYGEKFAEEMDIDTSKVTEEIKWSDDETMVMTVKFDSVGREELELENDESVIEAIVEKASEEESDVEIKFEEV